MMAGFPNMDAAKEAAGISLNDFRAYMPMHNYIYVPTRALWPAASVNSRLPAIKSPTPKASLPLMATGNR